MHDIPKIEDVELEILGILCCSINHACERQSFGEIRFFLEAIGEVAEPLNFQGSQPKAMVS